jgi:hypothetical protein
MDIKRLLKNKIIYRAAIFAVFLFFSGFSVTSAATLQINANSTILSAGDTTTLHVVVNTDGVAINNAEAAINFPNDLFDVVSISKTGSIFSLWVEDPAFSNSAGIITFNGGLPTPGFMGVQGSVVSIVVRAKKAGQAEFVFSGAAVRANDGLGTNVLTGQSGKTISVISKITPPAVVTPVAPVSDIAMQISSLTHPNQDQWYKDTSPTFQWTVPSGSDAVQTSIDSNTSGTPHVTYSPAISEKTVKDLKDGVWYFKVRARKGGVWGPTSIYIVRIDSTAPQQKDVTFSYDDGTKMLSIVADIQDITSGLDSYKIFINDILVKTVPAKEFVGGKYSLGVKAARDNEVRLVATDRAGNSVESSGTFHASIVPVSETKPALPIVSVNEQLITIGSFVFPTFFLVVLALVVILLLMILMYYLGHHYRRVQNKLMMRTALTKGDSSKALLLLRKRLESHLEILQHIRHGRILTKEEKEIKEAIEGDLDEIDRDINDRKQSK